MSSYDRCFKQGFFEVQDANSQLVAAFLDVKNACIDYLCRCRWENIAYAALMENKGLLIAMDLYESKLKQLKIRVKETEHLISNTALSTLQK
jgi:16S rRNA (cytosine967-C5)-methyltransferase